MKKYNKKFIASLILLLTFQGCMPDSLTKFKKEETKKAAVSSGNVTADPSAAADVNALTVFQLKNITAKSTTYHLHKSGVNNSTTACEVPVSEFVDDTAQLVNGSSDILCWLEAEEASLYFNGSDFQINIPPNECEYVEIAPYYYWSAPPANTYKILQEVDCQSDNFGCRSIGGVHRIAESEKSCVANYTDRGGPNCDEGEVTVNSWNVPADIPAIPAVLAVTEVAAVPYSAGPPVINAVAAVAGVIGVPGVPTILGVPQLISSTTTKCGGKRTNCYVGPGVDFKTTNGYPIPIDYLASDGKSINYSVMAPGPQGKGFSSNHYISNFTTLFEHHKNIVA